ncbi:PepSY-associated TM helix domain-containing protein [Pigmentiphaga humi]|nr:PepSY-associated TM helix domain-containing protein [Pigmentiphaga humi]
MGLALAGFLVVLGVSGSVLAFEDELEAWLNPDLFVVAAPPGGVPLDPLLLRERMTAALPGACSDLLPLRAEPGRSVRMRVRPCAQAGPGQPAALGYDEVFFDPYTGELLGVRLWGASLWDPRTAVSFVYRLHSLLAAPPWWGRLALGIVALAWTLDCFVGLALTLPRGAAADRRAGAARNWWQRWAVAWRIKAGASATRLTLDLHRAGGLWLWALLLVFAWSSVMFTLRDQVYYPVMTRLLTFNEPLRGPLPPSPPPVTLGWREALEAGRQAARELARRNGWQTAEEVFLVRLAARGVYGYWLHTDLDVRDGDGATGIIIDGQSGQVRGLVLPRDPGAAGNAFNQWMYGLHMAQVFGLPYRLLVAALGIAVAVLSVTGVFIWRKKRHARQVGAARRGLH